MRIVPSARSARGGTCLFALLALFLAAGCASDEADKASSTSAAPAVADTTPGAEGGNDAVTPRRRGNPIKVTWEALAHERHLYENPKYGQQPVSGGTPDFAIVLVNDDHPESDQLRQGRARGRQAVGSGVISNRDMQDFLKGLEQIGYFKSAAATSAQSRFFDDDRARGRVTVEQNGQSVTLLSMRGQGRSPTTKHIPGIYSQAKQAIAFLRNQSRTLTVETITRGDVPYR